jgi:hypothetical protein
MSGPSVPCAVGFFAEGCAHMRGFFARQIFVPQKPRIESWDAHHRGRARHQRHAFARIEFRHENDFSAAKEHRVDRHEKPVRVINRKRVKKHIGRLEMPDGGKRLGVRCEISVRQHRAFRAASGPGRIKDRGEIVRLAGGIQEIWAASLASIRQRPATIRAERCDRPHASPSRDRRQAVAPCGIADKEFRCR